MTSGKLLISILPSNISSVNVLPTSSNVLPDDVEMSPEPVTRKRKRLTHLSLEEKIFRKKMKNRMAAQSARDRKKAKMEELEMQLKLLETENKKLKEENLLLIKKTNKLNSENENLKQCLNNSQSDNKHKNLQPDDHLEHKESETLEYASLKNVLLQQGQAQILFLLMMHYLLCLGMKNSIFYKKLAIIFLKMKFSFHWKQAVLQKNYLSVSLIPDEAEDMWHAYNLIHEGDSLRASTIRKVQTESATGSVGSNRVRTVLTICVESTDFDTQACVLRVKGRNIQENQYVKLGGYHTLDLELNRKFTLAKSHWDCVCLERIEIACDPAQHADLAAVIMQEGLAHVCLVTSNMTLVRSKIEIAIPRKRKGQCAQHDKGLNRFYDAVLQAILRHVNFDIVKCILIASPGFVKDQFFDYIFQQADRSDNKFLLEKKSKFLLVHSSSGFKHSLKEILSDPSVLAKLSDTKAAGEVKALEQFYTTLQSEQYKACYGFTHVQKANEAQAIETLLVSDELFRSKDLAQRKQCVALVESIRENGGDVKIFSSLHVSGEQLNQLTGFAAILRFPMPELDEEAQTDSSDED